MMCVVRCSLYVSLSVLSIQQNRGRSSSIVCWVLTFISLHTRIASNVRRFVWHLERSADGKLFRHMHFHMIKAIVSQVELFTLCQHIRMFYGLQIASARLLHQILFRRNNGFKCFVGRTWVCNAWDSIVSANESRVCFTWGKFVHSIHSLQIDPSDVLFCLQSIL